MAARLRIFLIVASTPFFLKMPACVASVSGAKPVQPLMPMVTDVAAYAGTDSPTASANAAAATMVLFMSVPLVFSDAELCHRRPWACQ